MQRIEQFDKIYLINLKKRPDRLKKWFADNQSVIEPTLPIEIFEAVDGNEVNNKNWEFEKGALGCLESHLRILKDAKKNNYNNILIFEDDFIFDENFIEEFSNGLEELDPNWDMLYMCSNHFKEPKPFSEHLVKASASLTTVAYAVNAKAFDLLIMTLELKVREVDVVYAHLHFLLNVYCFKRNICHHLDGFSDIQNEVTYYQKKNVKHLLSKGIQSIKSIIVPKKS